MKKINIALCTVLIIAIACSELYSLNIYPNTLQMSTQGYEYGANMQKNGECNIINHILHDNDIVFDVGANIGEWSQYILSVNNTVTLYSFEPIPQIFSDLQSNLSKQNNTHPFNFAFSNKNGMTTFFYYEKSKELSTLSGLYHRPLVDSLTQSTPTRLSIATRTIDSFCTENTINYISLLKIDTEGAECDVLIGAKNMLQQNKIGIIQFEYGGTYNDSNITLKQVYTFLTKNNYLVYRIISKGLIEITHWENFLENYEYSNFLAISPQELHRIN